YVAIEVPGARDVVVIDGPVRRRADRAARGTFDVLVVVGAAADAAANQVELPVIECVVAGDAVHEAGGGAAKLTSGVIADYAVVGHTFHVVSDHAAQTYITRSEREGVAHFHVDALDALTIKVFVTQIDGLQHPIGVVVHVVAVALDVLLEAVVGNIL